MAKIYQLAMLAGTTMLTYTTAVCQSDGPSSLFSPPQIKRDLPTRKMCLDAINQREYDILIIGGGAVGVGCALEASTRGLKTVLVESEDFCSGTSSRSTKLLHGGIQDFNQAINNFDVFAFQRMRSSLQECQNIAKMGPHLNQPVPIMIPVHNWWRVPIYWIKLQLYNLIASRGSKGFFYINSEEALEIFPMMDPRKLFGAFVFYECQNDDARMCLSLALTASRYGADICNHLQVVELIKNKNNLVVGAKAVEQLSGTSYYIRAKIVINATGPLSDSMRLIENSNMAPLCTPNWSSHIVLPGFYCPKEVGVFDPHTKDGRIIFFLPWQRHTLMGTTETVPNVTAPKSTEYEIQHLLENIKRYVNPNFYVRRCDVLATWGACHPLAVQCTNGNLPIHNHNIHVSPCNMITIVGGTCTSFRLIAEHAVNAAIKYGSLEPLCNHSVTKYCKLDGAAGWSPSMFIRLVQDFGFEQDVAKHLSNTYGSNAFKVAFCAGRSGKNWPIVGKRLHTDFPYIEAEVKQGVQDYACTLVDMLARRLRIAFLNVHAAEEILPRVAHLMAAELKWSKEYIIKQMYEAKSFLRAQVGHTIGEGVGVSVPIKMSAKQVQTYTTHFKNLDDANTGYVSISQCCVAMKALGVKEVPVDLLHDVLRDIDIHSQGKVNLYEFLLLMSAIVEGETAYLRYAKMFSDKI